MTAVLGERVSLLGGVSIPRLHSLVCKARVLKFGTQVKMDNISGELRPRLRPKTRFSHIFIHGGGGGFLAHAIRLAAKTIEPFHLESPKFLTSLICLADILW